jgi:hypothetical protein
MATCSKTFTLTVAPSAVPPTIYYKFDSIVGGEFIDSMDGANMINANNTHVIVPGFRLNCAKQINAFPIAQVDYPKSDSAYLNLSTLLVGITYRLWYRFDSLLTTPGMITILSNHTGLHYGSADMMLYNNSGRWRARFNYDLLHEVQTIPIPADTNWHRLLWWLDVPTRWCGLQLDNLAPAMNGPVDDLSSLWGDQHLFIGVAGGSQTPFYIDEYGIWSEHVMDAAERLADWNGGAGITWPEGT